MVESVIDSKLVVNRKMTTNNRVIGFCQEEGVDLDVTLASRFSQKEGGDLVEVIDLVAKVFKVLRGILMFTI